MSLPNRWSTWTMDTTESIPAVCSPTFKRGDRVRRTGSAIEGTVLSVYETMFGKRRTKARVRWERTLQGGSRLGTGSTDYHTAVDVTRLELVTE